MKTTILTLLLLAFAVPVVQPKFFQHLQTAGAERDVAVQCLECSVHELARVGEQGL